MPCVDHDYKNCPSYIELAEGEKCAVPGCERGKDSSGHSETLFGNADDLESNVQPGKTGGRQGTI